jgi:RNA polymerase sigma-70 factor (ECF subfamily)
MGPAALLDSDSEVAQLESFRGRLRVFAARRLRDWSDAEDVAQETLERVLEALRAGRLRDPGALTSYLFQTASRVCLHRIRSAGREKRAYERLAPVGEEAAEESPLGALISAQERSSVFEALGKLGAEDQKVLELTFREDLDAAEIGRRLGLTAGTVCVRRHRAIRRLAKILGVRKETDRDPDV